jgi:hypothetical protein
VRLGIHLAPTGQTAPDGQAQSSLKRRRRISAHTGTEDRSDDGDTHDAGEQDDDERDADKK